MKHTVPAALLLVLAGSLTMAQPSSSTASAGRAPELSTEVRREGTGDRRAKLNATELKVFDFAKFASLKDATGELPTAESAKGKAILIFTFTAWDPSSKKALTRIADLATQYGKDGLQIVAVHADKQFEAGQKLVQDSKVECVLARDEGGKFRSAILSDGDPDIYVIDRAGQMRFADIETDSVEAAVKTVMGETAEDSMAALAKLNELNKAEAEKQRRTSSVSDVYRPGVKVRGVYTPPPASEYEKVLWPRQNPKTVVSELGTDVQGKELPKTFPEIPTMEWLTEKPAADDYKGKVIVLDFWATWCGPCLRAKPMLDDLAEKNRDDLMIIGISGMDDPKAKVKSFLANYKNDLLHVYDTDKKAYEALSVNAIPMTLILSSDGKVRWQGHPGQAEFRQNVESMIANDPGVAARRKSDAAARKAAGG